MSEHAHKLCLPSATTVPILCCRISLSTVEPYPGAKESTSLFYWTSRTALPEMEWPHDQATHWLTQQTRCYSQVPPRLDMPLSDEPLPDFAEPILWVRLRQCCRNHASPDSGA
jgi:hypothetical protein